MISACVACSGYLTWVGRHTPITIELVWNTHLQCPLSTGKGTELHPSNNQHLRTLWGLTAPQNYKKSLKHPKDMLQGLHNIGLQAFQTYIQCHWQQRCRNAYWKCKIGHDFCLCRSLRLLGINKTQAGRHTPIAIGLVYVKEIVSNALSYLEKVQNYTPLMISSCMLWCLTTPQK